jgi:hypothetical protein
MTNYKFKALDINAVQIKFDPDNPHNSDIMLEITELLNGTGVAALFGILNDNDPYVSIDIEGEVSRLRDGDWVAVYNKEFVGLWSDKQWQQFHEVIN